MALVANYGGASSDESEEDVNSEVINGVAACTSQAKSTSNQSEEILEDFVKKTNYGDVPIEKPPPKPPVSEALSKMRLPAVKKGKIQISIPSIQDSDSDEEEPKIKKTKSSLGAAGFLGSLPAPRASGGGKDAGRSFIPYTLTKQKPAASSKPALRKSNTPKPSTGIKPKPKRTDEYSDSDDEQPQSSKAGPSSSENFFSLTSDPEPVRTNFMGSAHAVPSVVSNTLPSNVYTEDDSHTRPRITAASLYNMSEDMEEYPQDTSHEEMDYTANPSLVDNLLQDEQFLRLQGKKQRGKETIELIDIHTDDQKVSEVELTKNLTQEVDPSAFAHRKKGEGPSGQQKRKHQITYLAFQAKERELELKNTWAANRASKQQTQAKYGF